MGPPVLADGTERKAGQVRASILCFQYWPLIFS